MPMRTVSRYAVRSKQFVASWTKIIMDAKSKEKAEKAVQSYAALSVGFVCIVVGLPLWWKTTEVYRVHLPHSEIATLAESQVVHKIDFSVIVFDDPVKPDFMNKLTKEVRININTVELDGLTLKYNVNVRQGFDEEKQVFKTSNSVEELNAKLAKQRIVKENGKYSVAVLPGSWDNKLNAEAVVHTHRTAYIKWNNDIPSLGKVISRVVQEIFVDEHSMGKSYQSAQAVVHQMADKESMRFVRYHPGYDTTFTLLNPQPDILKVTWDIKGAISAYLKPLLKSFETFAEITVKSQYIHYIGLSVRPDKDEKNNRFTYKEETLPHLINPIEGHLGSHVSTNPNLNFVVYIPTRDQSPLHILDNQGNPSADNAFLSPRWGGLHIHNMASPDENDTLPKPVSVDMKEVMQIFISQLRMLIGITTQTSTKDVQITQPGNAGVTEWEVDKWLRSRALENVATSTATLRSLIQLLDEVGNIVINDDIGLEVTRAVDSIQKSHTALQNGQLHEAFLASRQAMISSEKAFFDPSLLELLYFPEDQKFAIYIPLFLPISIPVILSIIQAVKWIRGKDEKQKKE